MLATRRLEERPLQDGGRVCPRISTSPASLDAFDQGAPAAEPSSVVPGVLEPAGDVVRERSRVVRADDADREHQHSSPTRHRLQLRTVAPRGRREPC